MRELSDLSDLILLGMVAEKDEAALREIVERHSPWLLLRLLRTMNAPASQPACPAALPDATRSRPTVPVHERSGREPGIPASNGAGAERPVAPRRERAGMSDVATERRPSAPSRRDERRR